MPSLNGNVAALALLALCGGEPALARTPEPPTAPTAEPAPRPATVRAPATPDDPSVRREEGSCCNGMGGPFEEVPVVVVGPVADPREERSRLAPIDSSLERRYAPRPAPSLNPITLRF